MFLFLFFGGGGFMLFRAMISLTDVGLLCSTTRPGKKRFFCRPHPLPTPTPSEFIRAVTLLYFESAVPLDKLLARTSNTRRTFKIVKSSGQHCVSKLLRVSNEESGRIWSEVQVFEQLMMDPPPPPPPAEYRKANKWKMSLQQGALTFHLAHRFPEAGS